MRHGTTKWMAAGAMGIALALAGCGGGGGSAMMEPEPTPIMCADGQEPNAANDGCVDTAETVQMKALSAAREAAMTAATDADEAADAAEMAANAQMATMAADEANYALAQNAAMRARTASDAASAASAAAAATDDVAEAQRQQGIAEAQKMTAETEQASAVKYAGMVAAAHQENLDEIQRQMDVADARTAAMGSYEAAAADAVKAEAQADEAEATAPGSAGAMDARAAATAARSAADAAKEAHDAIADDMTKAEADAQAELAATEAGKANTQYMAAKDENDDIQTAAITGAEGRRVQAVADARKYGGMAVENAKMAADDALAAANAAKMASNAANAAYMQAMSGRTDGTEAKKQADAAQAAYMAAKMASDAANAAYMAAKAAIEDVMDDSTLNAANTARTTADTEAGKAAASKTTAMMKQTDAEGARDMAVASRGTHVLSLFLAANGAHVTNLESTPTIDEKAVHVGSVGTAMATIAGAASGNQAADTTGTATYPGDTVDNPATAATNEFAEGMFSFTVNVAGTTSITSELRESTAHRVATDLNNDGDTTDDGEAVVTQTARAIDDLGAFRGYDLWEDDGVATTTTDRARAIVFTNKKQGDDSKLARDGGAARSVKGQTVAAGELSNVRSSGNTITGVTWKPSGQAPLMGTLTCGDACDITLGADGAVTTITGYTFTGSRASVEAVTAADAAEDNDYLIFGLWLEESDDGTTDTFGAFANGGTGYAVGAQTAVTGTAVYNGKAAGAHHKTGEGVNWFDGNARLTAAFGTATADGTVSGSISGIRVNGGPAMSTPIYLGQTTLTGGTATFNGMAFMGGATAPGAVTHEFDGTWSGSFFGDTEDDADTADVNESVTAPKAAAGTFGVTKSMGTGDDMVVESFVGAFGADLSSYVK